MGPDVAAEQQRYRNSLEEEVRNCGFSEARYLRKGASGIGFYVVDTRTRQPALLKMAAAESGSEAVTLTYELDVLTGRRPDTAGLSNIAGYPLAEVPEGVVPEPTMRGVAKLRSAGGFLHIGYKPALLLEWIEEAEIGQPGYHRLDRLIADKSGAWTDLEILDLVAPFAYLLARAHKKGVIYNDIGADKADHLYYDEQKHQLKVIDWANCVFMRDANYNGARQPFHDVTGLARLIYCMRTNADARALERSYNAQVLRDNLQRSGHPALAQLIYRSLIYTQTDHPERLSGEEAPITDGEGLYNAIAQLIRSFRGELREPELPPVEAPPRQRLILRRPSEPVVEQPVDRLRVRWRIGRPSLPPRPARRLVIRKPAQE